MKTTTITLMLALVPSVLCAQVSAQAGGSAQAGAGAQRKNGTTSASASGSASADANAEYKAPPEYSAEGKAKLEAMYADARSKRVPVGAIARRVAEGRAKGAAEANVIASAQGVKANLEAAQSAMVSAGRAKTSDKEIERGATAMERGVTRAELEVMARKAPADRSLVVAFEVLSKLRERGVSSAQALAQVEGKLASNASDGALNALVTAGTGAQAAGGSMNVAGTAAGSANAATRGAGVAGSVTGAAAGTIKKP